MDVTSLDASLNVLSGYDAASSVSTGSLAYAVGLSMLDMNMELMETMNQQMIQAMEQSVTPHLGGSIDVYV